ncbi:MAG: hypothetical protein ACFFAX_13055 [Promethearchaeota archaeon]
MTALVLILTLSYILNMLAPSPSIMTFLLMLVALSAPLGFKILKLSRYFDVLSPFHSFYDVSFFLHRGSLEFRSEGYYRAFKKLNPDSGIPASHNDRIRLTSGSEDEGTDVAFACLFGPGLCVMGLMTLLTFIGGFQDLALFLPILSCAGLILVLTYIIEAGFYRAFGVPDETQQSQDKHHTGLG